MTQKLNRNKCTGYSTEFFMRCPFLFGVAVFLITISTHAQGQVSRPGQLPHGKPSIVRFDLKKQQLRIGQSQKALQENLGTGPQDKLQLLDASTDRAGYHHQKFQQFYKGLKVEYGIYTVHARNTVVESISGEYYRVPDLSVKPTLSERDAFQKALRVVEETQPHRKLDSLKGPSRSAFTGSQQGELLICPKLLQKKVGDETEMALAYKFDIYVPRPLSRTLIYVDAHTGEIIHKTPLIKHAEGTAATRYSGTRSIQTHEHSSGFILKDVTRGAEIHTYNMLTKTDYTKAVEFSDTDNDWTSGEHDNLAKDNAALDAHWGATMTYDYFLNKHLRNSFDGHGATIKNYVHFDKKYENAFWDGSAMSYGDGDLNFDAFTSLDVVAHELGHAVCEHTANLIYYGESGALNEGLSDIWGAMVEHFAASEKNTWLIGEEIVKYGDALRSMSNPKSSNQPDTYLGNNWYDGLADYGGVHTNSGVLNYWYYLLAVGKSGTNDNGESYNVVGIGMDKAADIVYRTESAYLTGNSKYVNARKFSIQAATDLFGANSNEVIQTVRAWNAVGVYDEDLEAPSDLEATVASATSVLLQWQDNSAHETGFKIHRSNSGDDFELVATVGANVTSYTDAGLPQNAYLYYSVSAIKDGALSVPSNEAIAILGIPPPTVSPADSLALVALYVHANGQNWIHKDKWLGGQVNTWYGVKVENGRVTSLSLGQNNLSGVIPYELGNCTALKTLHLGYNELRGDIPTSIGNLRNLQHLILLNNDLDGVIPAVLGNLTSLKTLNLSYNKISGDIPVELSRLTALQSLCIERNQLTGEIPSDLGKLVMLQELMLPQNQLHGSIPETLGDLVYLRSLRLFDNQLTGSIPTSLGNLRFLEELVLTSNQLSGTIPTELGNLTNLHFLGLNMNHLTGEIPRELGALRDLYSLYLNTNSLTGTIPHELGNLESLQFLALNGNELTGEIPASLGNLTELYGLSLAFNKLTGSIPGELGNLTILIELYLNDNELTGTIPANFSNLTKLDQLYLNNNKLSGSPESLSGLSPFIMDLTNNRFTALPVFAGYPRLLVAYNKLTFESLEINLGQLFYTSDYSPQDSVGVRSTLDLSQGQSVVLSALTGGTNNNYQWTRNGNDIPGETSATLNVSLRGIYSCKITNTDVTGLTLYRRKVIIRMPGVLQTITFPAIEAVTYSDQYFSPAATASSGLDIRYESSDPAVASVTFDNIIAITGVGTATITAYQDGDDLFDAALPVQQTLVVNKGLLVAKADDKIRTYGEQNPELTISYTGFVNGDNVTDIEPPVASVTATAASNADVYPITLSGGSSENYDITLENGYFLVERATIVATADDQTKVYGAEDPEFTIRYAGFVNGDDEDDIIPPRAVVQGHNAGVYPIILIEPAPSTNYKVSVQNGSLTIIKATLIVKAENNSRIYGAEDPQFTFSYSGFVYGDGEEQVNRPSVSIAATATSDVGTYPITISGGSAANYDLVLQQGASLTVTKAMLYARADDRIKTYGAENPELTVTCLGFVNGDDITDITPPVASADATKASDVGEYRIALSGGSALNYNFLFTTDGMLTITKAPLAAKPDDQTKIYGAENPEFTITYTGFVNGDDVSNITPPVASVADTNTGYAGSYDIVLNGGSAKNYYFVLYRGLFVVNKADQVINFETIQTQTFGNENLTLGATSSAGLPVSYESNDLSKAVVAANHVTFLSPGYVTITAKQSGNPTCNAASPVSRSFCINPAKPVITVDLTDPGAPILTSSISHGNQWYKDATALAGASEMTFTALVSGHYTVTASVDQCTSEPSDEAHVNIGSDGITGVNPFEPDLVRLYPNPVDRQFELVFNEASRKEVDIIHFSGTVVQHFSTTGLNEIVDVTNLASGLYLVKIHSQKQTHTLKFVKN